MSKEKMSKEKMSKKLKEKNEEIKIYHIDGPSGAGKSTLGRQLAALPNTIVIDTDDIDDTNVMRALDKFAFKTEDIR
jgi:cytidylate kinase